MYTSAIALFWLSIVPPSSENSQRDRYAGSPVDNKLGDKIHDLFTELKMEPWVDEHYVKLQYPNRSVGSPETLYDKKKSLCNQQVYSGNCTAVEHRKKCIATR